MPRFNGTPVASSAPASGGRFGGTPAVARNDALAASDTPPEGARPGSKEYADWAVARVRAGKTVPNVSEHSEDFTRSPMGKFNAAYTSLVDAIPIAGPKLLEGAQNMRAAIQGMTPEEVEREQAIYREANPTAATAGAITGTVAPFALAATVPVVSTILGVDVAAPLAVSAITGAGSQKIISHFDQLARGQDPNQTVDIAGMEVKPEDIAAVTGAAAPIVGRIVGKGLEAVNDKVVQPVVRAVRGTVDPTGTAASTITKAAQADVAAGPVLSQADEAAALVNSQPIVNADRFGTNVRTLARTAGNYDPSAREALSEITQDRFLTQNVRASNWVTRNTGAPTDVFAVQQSIDRAAKGVNNAAYKTAYTQPGAQAVWAPEIEQMMQSENFRSAIKAAIKTSGEEAALTGAPPLKNPFVIDPKTGSYRLRMQSDAAKANLNKAIASKDEAAIRTAREIYKDALADDAPIAEPTLEFWDHVQRALRRRAAQLGRSGEFDFDAGQVSRLRTQLNDVLDTAVPEFAQARGGAARWFGAEDALEAGQKFVSSGLKNMPEAAAAHAKFSPVEKKLFASGFAASLLNKIGQTGDNVNVINKVFASPQARAQIELAMGPKAAAELEPFLRVENTMQLLKQATQGGSNTVQQQIAAGIARGGTNVGLGYGAGATLGGGGLDPRNWGTKAWAIATLGAAGRMGAKALTKNVDQRVMQEIARLLSSDDPKLIEQAIKNAARSPKSAAAVKAIEFGLTNLIRGTGAGASTAAATESVN